MANRSVTTAPSNAVEAARQLFGEHPGDVVGVVDIGAARLLEMAELFRAIGQAAASESNRTSIERLASLGSYLAEDTGNFLDERQEHYAKSLAAVEG